MANLYINVYKNNPTEGQTDGTPVSLNDVFLEPIKFSLKSNESKTLKLAIRTEENCITAGETTIKSNNENLKLSWAADGTFAESISTKDVAATNKIFYAQVNQSGTLARKISFDVKTRTKDLIATWLYYNIGTADLLLTNGVTLSNLPSSKSTTGTAFYQKAQEKCFDIPELSEIWIKFDVYFNKINRWRAFNGGDNDVTGIKAQINNGLSFFANGENVTPKIYDDVNYVFANDEVDSIPTEIFADDIVEPLSDANIRLIFDDDVINYEASIPNICKPNQLQTFLLHMKSDESEGIIEAWGDGEKIYTYTGDVNHGEKFSDIYLQSDGEGTFFSNVIISDEEITEIFHDVEFSADVLCSFVIDIKIHAKEPTRSLRKNSSPQKNSRNTVEGNTVGMQSIEINIAEQQITDTFKVVGIVPFEIMTNIRGQYLDYICDVNIESIRQQGILYHCTCHTNISEIFYTPLNYSLPSESHGINSGFVSTRFFSVLIFPEASKHVEKIAEAMGLQPIMQFKDFYSTVDFGYDGEDEEREKVGASYNDLIREIFGWSSRVPTNLINVYIRDGKLFVIQRGYEANVIDISNGKLTKPVFNRELVRMYYQRGKYSSTQVTGRKSGRPIADYADPKPYASDIDDELDFKTPPESVDQNPYVRDDKVFIVGKDGTTDTKNYYNAKGLLTESITKFTSSNDQTLNTTTITKHRYLEYDNRLERVTVATTHPFAPEEDTKTITDYGYIKLENGSYYLSTEMVTKYENVLQENGKYAFTIADVQVITKNPTGRGQASNSDNKGHTNASSNIGNDSPTPYQDKGITLPFLQNETIEIEGLALFDTSFPIQDISDEIFPEYEDVDRAKGRGYLEELTEKIKWLNQRTKETVNLSLFEYEHLIDFNDRIIFNGNEYFLVSNTATSTSRVYNEQNLTLVRWY